MLSECLAGLTLPFFLSFGAKAFISHDGLDRACSFIPFPFFVYDNPPVCRCSLYTLLPFDVNLDSS